METLLRQLRGFAKPLAKVVLTVFLGLLVFELAQDFLWPDLPQWKSHAIEVMYGVLLAGVVGYFALRMHTVLYEQVLEENEKYRISETEPRRNKEWFRSLTEYGTDLITVIDPKGTILYDSPSIERIFGYRPIERQGKSVFDFVHPEDIPGARSIIERAFQELGSSHTIEMRVRGQDGRWHVFESTGRAILDHSTGRAILDHEGKLCGVINSRNITERKQAEAELVRSETKFRMLFESNSDAMMLLDKNGFFDCNKAALTIFGCATREEFCSKHPADLSPLEQPCGTSSMMLANQRIATAMEKGSLRFEWVHKRAATDKTFPAEVQLTATELDGKQVLWAIVQDITERKQTEKSLTLFRTLLDRAHDSLEVIDPETGRFLDVNEQACLDLGYTRDELLSMTVPDIDPIVNRSAFDLIVARLRTAQSSTLESIHRRKDGTTFPVEINAKLVQVERGYVVAVVRDITERKRMEEELRASAEYARNLIEASLDPLVTINPDGKITDVNKATEAITGLPRKRLIGSDFSGYFMEPDRAREGYRQALAQGAVRDYPLTIRHASGGLTDVLYNATVYCDKEGAVQGVLATARDITERKRMQEQAARTERLAALGQLLGGIAHEIKNPLFVMTGRLQLLKEKLANREYDTLGTELQPIEEAGKRITAITQRFLNLARPFKPKLQSCSVHDVLTQTLDFLANELMKDHIQVVLAFAPNMPQTWSEPRQLYAVFLNLILNAMQAMTAAHGQGTLTITTSHTTDSIMVRIQDDGPGIPPQHCARLFEPFFSTKPPGQGTGLGLWTVRSTLAGLNGTADCESEEGKGVTFIVRIPIVSHPPKE